ncbi:MAG: hypothetical protein LBE61_21130 [Burkholderiaceae bacterium]|nr:hypothetical protein [Burkholderiaceae bacterium]
MRRLNATAGWTLLGYGGVGALMSCAGAAHAALFATDFVTGSVPGTWQQDRYPPAVFAPGSTLAGRSDVLDIGVTAADSAVNRPSNYVGAFYNTQGRGLELNLPGYAVVYGSFYIPQAWATSSGPTQNRRADLWAEASPATGSDSCSASGCNFFPIVGFSNADKTSQTTAGGTGRYRVFDGTAGWSELDSIPVKYDDWSDVCIAFTGNSLVSYVNGAPVYTQTNMQHNDVGTLGPTTHISRVIMQVYNFGGDYTDHWSGLGAGQLGSLGVSAGSGQSTPVGSSFSAPLSVLVKDTDGAPLPCVPVTFEVPASNASATLDKITVVTNRAGLASVQAMANTIAGDYAVTASAPGQQAPVSFALKNAAPPPPPPPAPPASPTPVPALDGGGLLLTSAGIAAAMAYLARRRRSIRAEAP